jgi:hypothetical protein
MIGTRRSFQPNFQKKNCVNLLTAFQSCPDFTPNFFTPNPLKYPYFAIKQKIFITYIYIDTKWAEPLRTQRHVASFGTTPFKSMGFQLGRPDQPEQSSYR